MRLTVQVPVLVAILFAREAHSYDVQSSGGPAERRPGNALEVLASRLVWKDLPSDFLKALAERLGSAEKAAEFAGLCENTGILENNIVRIATLPEFLRRFGADEDSIATRSRDTVEYEILLVAVALTSYGNAMGERQRYGEARKGFEFALLLYPDYPAALFGMMLMAYQTGDRKSAAGWADRVLEYEPDGLIEGGLGAVERLRDSQPELADEMTTPDFQWMREMARQVKEACVYRSAPHEPQIAEGVFPQNSEFASYAEVKADLDGAIARTTRAIQENPTNLFAYAVRASAYADKGEHEKALADANRAIHLAPEETWAWFVRGVANYVAGEYEKAVSDHTMAVLLDSSNAKAYLGRAVAEAHMGQWQDVIADASKAIELEPNLAQAYFVRGAARFETGDYLGAQSDLARAAELDPQTYGED